ncbi:hypothetical protein AB0N14_27385 [Streptomyces sp. NPDC051104]|uniref:hypothetical protein n=1 Tax=Streptomyces sp. NPDC051104 TaxID=3155044 RepID=UPI00341CB1A8
MSAEDETERKRIEARLYAVPVELRRPRRAARARQPQQSQQPPEQPARPPRAVMTMADAQALMAQWGATDAQLGTG